jgi:hypothetical protein
MPPRSRRGTSRLAVVLATLAVPLVPGQAVAAAPTSGGGVVRPDAPSPHHHRHHPDYRQMDPGAGVVMVQEWEVSGWTITFAGRPADLGLARSRVVPEPLITPRMPLNTKQMLPGVDQPTDLPDAAAVAPAGSAGVALPADLLASSCRRPDGSAGVGGMRTTDSHMLAHLRPAADPMNVVVSRGGAPCGARVDYLSQARA